jgi:hypothetical protein
LEDQEKKTPIYEACLLDEDMKLIVENDVRKVRSRNSVFEQFEACYLKENCARKAFSNPDALQKLVSKPDFERVVKYMANLTFNKNQNTLLKHGFDYDDMVSVIRILAMQFVNHPFEAKTRKDQYYVLMHFINQRLDTFYIFMNRKFRIPETYLELNLEDVFENHPYKGDYPISATVEEEDPETEVPMILESESERIIKRNQMRSKLEANLPEFKGKLAEIATSKVVEFKVRKKARMMCQKYGIDYLTWARAQIKSRNLNENDFVLE